MLERMEAIDVALREITRRLDAIEAKLEAKKRPAARRAKKGNKGGFVTLDKKDVARPSAHRH